MGINAAIAAYYKVPVILLTGDSETCRMASALLGDFGCHRSREGAGLVGPPRDWCRSRRHASG